MKPFEPKHACAPPLAPERPHQGCEFWRVDEPSRLTKEKFFQLLLCTKHRSLLSAQIKKHRDLLAEGKTLP